MRFRLFGIRVEVQLLFWVTGLLLGLPAASGPPRPGAALGLWMLAVFVSVLVHELGHAFAMRRHGINPEISLHGMGGVTTWGGAEPPPLRRRDLVVIYLAGPLAGF